jgi:peptide/nickel transport system permease protein
MLSYMIRRMGAMVILVFAASMIAFIVIELPPGDYVTSYLHQLESSGQMVTDSQAVALRQRYGLDLPPVLRYFKWLGNLAQGDLGRSFRYNKPVKELLAERLPFTFVIAITTLIFTYLVAIPIGIYSATHQYSVGDYFFSVLGFAGLAIPSFLLALILMYVLYMVFGVSIGGLFSLEYRDAPWSIGKVWDLVKHLPVPVVVVGMAGTAALVRIMRSCLLDELNKQYVVTARCKGLTENTLLFKYPVSISINPIVSTIGWTLPQIVSGGTIVAIVLSLPTTGPLLFQALLTQDMYLAGSTIMILTILTVVGTLLSDVLLAWMDPRIRYERRG